MKIRQATLAEVPLLAALNDHVHALHVLAEPEVYRPTVHGELQAHFRKILADEKAQVLVVEVGERPVGYVVVREVRSAGHTYHHPMAHMLVDELAVAPAFRRRGLGRALMNAVEARARELRLDTIVLDVRAHNQAAKAFYEALGYASVQLRMARRLS